MDTYAAQAERLNNKKYHKIKEKKKERNRNYKKIKFCKKKKLHFFYGQIVFLKRFINCKISFLK